MVVVWNAITSVKLVLRKQTIAPPAIKMVLSHIFMRISVWANALTFTMRIPLMSVYPVHHLILVVRTALPQPFANLVILGMSFSIAIALKRFLKDTWTFLGRRYPVRETAKNAQSRWLIALPVKPSTSIKTLAYLIAQMELLQSINIASNANTPAKLV